MYLVSVYKVLPVIRTIFGRVKPWTLKPVRSVYSLHAGAVNESGEGVSGRRVVHVVAFLGHHLVQGAREHVRQVGGHHRLGGRDSWHDGLEKEECALLWLHLWQSFGPPVLGPPQ